MEENYKEPYIPLVLKNYIENRCIGTDFIKQRHLTVLVFCNKVNRKREKGSKEVLKYLNMLGRISIVYVH